MLDLAPRPSPTLALGFQHRARPHLLANALCAAREAAPHLAEFAAFLLPGAPRRPLASQTIRSDVRDRHSDPFLLDDAVSLPWLALDSQEARNVLAVDVDHPAGPERAAALAADYGLPRPTLVLDPWSGRSHAVWRLATPVLMTEGAKQGPRILANLAGRLLAAGMNGTLLPPRSLLKCPWGRSEHLIGSVLRRVPQPAVPALWAAHQVAGTGLLWHTEPGDLRAVELREILAALADDFGEEVAAPTTRKRFRHRGEPSALGRNCSLFDAVRWWAYDRAETDARAITDEVDRVNGLFAEPLPRAEVAATARSIARFMATRYRPRSAAQERRGRDAQDGADLDRHGRQQLAGRRSATVRSSTTDTRIAAAVAALQAAGRTPTQAAIVAETGLGERTVRRRWTRPIAVLSGSAPLGAPGAVGARLEETRKILTPFSPSLGEVARRDRWIRRIVALFAAVAEAAHRPGAPVVVLPEVPSEVAGVREVREARQLAEAALVDARRRAAARADRAEAAARRSDFEIRLRQDPAAAWRWWRAELRDLDTGWDALESHTTDPRALLALQTRREAVIGGRWRSWRAAVGAVQGAREPEPVIPW